MYCITPDLFLLVEVFWFKETGYLKNQDDLIMCKGVFKANAFKMCVCVCVCADEEYTK